MSRKHSSATRQPAVIDACCLLDLLVTGMAQAILQGTGHAWNLPTAVHTEVQFIRTHDPDSPGSHKTLPVDLAPLIQSGVLTPSQPDNPAEQAAFVHYAAHFRSDGEAMCLALAQERGWIVASDDRKAIRVARQAGLTVVSCPEIIRAWAKSARPDAATLRQTLSDIETLARFRPNPAMPESDWWDAQSQTH